MLSKEDLASVKQTAEAAKDIANSRRLLQEPCHVRTVKAAISNSLCLRRENEQLRRELQSAVTARDAYRQRVFEQDKTLLRIRRVLPGVAQPMSPTGASLAEDVERVVRELRGTLRECHEAEQALAEALGGYPKYGQDEGGKPGEFCIGEHTTGTLAKTAAWRLQGGMRERHETEQVLAKALGVLCYPELYPQASRVDDGTLCIGDHTVVTIAMEAAGVLLKLKQMTQCSECGVMATILWEHLPTCKRGQLPYTVKGK